MSKRVATWFRRWPLVALLPVLIAAVWVTVAPPYTNSPPIRSDGLGYYAWNDAIVSGEFGFCRWSKQLDVITSITYTGQANRGRCEEKYPPGLALLRLPVMGPIAAIAGDPSELKVSPAEEKASLWLGVVALVITVTLIGLTLRELEVPWLIADLVTLVACFGTGLFHYGTFDSSFTHVYSAALTAALVLIGVRSLTRGRAPNRWWLLFLSFFISLIREPNIVVLLLLSAIWLLAWRRQHPSRRPLRDALGLAWPVLAGIALAVVLQLLYNHWAIGAWNASSYAGESFSLKQLDELKVLFSYNHGLVLWYPILTLFLIVAACVPAARWWCLTAALTIAALTFVYGSWNPWYLGGGFGERAFVDVVPVVAAAGGVGIAGLKRRGRALAAVAACLCVFVTLELMGGYWGGSLAPAHSGGSQYWQHVVGSHSVF